MYYDNTAPIENEIKIKGKIKKFIKAIEIYQKEYDFIKDIKEYFFCIKYRTFNLHLGNSKVKNKYQKPAIETEDIVKRIEIPSNILSILNTPPLKIKRNRTFYKNGHSSIFGENSKILFRYKIDTFGDYISFLSIKHYIKGEIVEISCESHGKNISMRISVKDFGKIVKILCSKKSN